MKLRRLLPALAWCLLTAVPALAIDSVSTKDGKTVNGTISTIGKTEVVITDQIRKMEQKIPTNTIESIKFNGEPPRLSLVRSAIHGGNYDAAITQLEDASLDPSTITRLEVKQDVLFYKAQALAQLAMGGSGDLKVAGGAMKNFVEGNAGSWHYFDAVQTLGDLYLAIGAAKEAGQEYAKLESAPWDDYKMRGKVAMGRALQNEGKFQEALSEYEDALRVAGASPSDKLVITQQLNATVGKAACLAKLNKAAEGAKLIEDVIAKADPEQSELHAIAYTTLGNCYEAAGRDKDALLAFLHVDVLYYAYPRYHAEALYNLSKLWKTAGSPERGVLAQQTLATRYANSIWAQKK